MFTYDSLKRILFLLDPETAHTLVEFCLRFIQKFAFMLGILKKLFLVQNNKLSQDILGIKFANPLGLAAGFDKNATMLDATLPLGFSYTEIGTFTPKAQEGNAKPRLFRHIKEQSLQNAMGFNNLGKDCVKRNILKRKDLALVLGVNIGKNKATSQENALEDYLSLIKEFTELCDYLCINISSPNTKGLRDLQNIDFIKELFISARKITKKPIFLKISPDMSSKKALELCKCAIKYGASGIVATNTTVDYSLVENAKENGGLSGEVLREKSYIFFKELAYELYGKTILISVGGINSYEEAYRRLKAGASLLQIFTGFIYKGPNLQKNINQGILKLMSQDGFKNIKEAIGSDLK